MKSRTLALIAFFVFAACGGEDDGTIDPSVECKADLFTGDLVITEVMANPEGDDEGNEYFEIYNATGNAIDLTGLLLIKTSLDGTGEKLHQMSERIIEPGSYLALGGVLPEFRAPYIGYGYGSDLGTMTNGGGILALQCNDVEVDNMTYGEATSGRSQGLDGNLVPDHLANDTLENFCDASSEFAVDSFGSPGVANDPCSIVEQTSCLDGDSERDVVKPSVGDLVITEFMANPDGADASREWFEVQATATVDLNGLVAGTEIGDPKINIVRENCVVAQPGDSFLFAQSSDSAVNGGLPAPDFTFSFTLTNASGSSGSLFIGVGETVIDDIVYTSTDSGKSTSLDPGQINAAANDNEDNWCPGRSAYGDGNLGTPGEQNDLCDTSGMCDDGGSLRPSVAPVAEDVTITEFSANPNAVGDTAGEFIEVHFASAVDLNGLQLGEGFDPVLEVDTTFNQIECLPVPADTHVVFARNTDPQANGGLPITNIFQASFSLTNGGDSIFVAHDDVLLDGITFVGADVGDGVSTQVNDGTLCPSTQSYGDGDLGSPGLANEGCP